MIPTVCLDEREDEEEKHELMECSFFQIPILDWMGWMCSNGDTEGMEGCHRGQHEWAWSNQEDFLGEAMNTTESDAENDNNQHVKYIYM